MRVFTTGTLGRDHLKNVRLEGDTLVETFWTQTDGGPRRGSTIRRKGVGGGLRIVQFKRGRKQ